ncbi:MAG: hypothetical protein WCL71_17765 [Deltaproteobacteria bacterium]
MSTMSLKSGVPIVLCFIVFSNFMTQRSWSSEIVDRSNVSFSMEDSLGGIQDLEVITRCFEAVKAEVKNKKISLSKSRLSLVQFMTADQMKKSLSSDVKASMEAVSVNALLAKKKAIMRIVFAPKNVQPGGVCVFFCNPETGEVLLIHQSR